jgi:hypothetical protein
VKSWALGIGVWALGTAGVDAPVVLENEHVRVTRNAAPCADAGSGCGDRVVVLLSGAERGAVRVFRRGNRHAALPGEYFEVNIKPNRPPIKSPSALIPPDKNSILHEGDDFFVFEEKLDPGDTRTRHSHRERVVIVINKTRLQQWPEGAPEIFRDQVPDDVRFNPPVIHVVKTVGDRPLRNIVIEFKR